MPAYERLEHTGNATETTIVGSITDSATSITIAASTGWPTGGVGPFYVIIDPDNASLEKVKIVSRSGTTLTVASGGRGVDGTTAVAHNGAAIYPVFPAVEADEANAHIADDSLDHHSQYVHISTARTISVIHDFTAGIDVTAANVRVTGAASGFGASAKGGAGTQITLGNQADASNTRILAGGSGANVGIALVPKGTGSVYVQPQATTAVGFIVDALAATSVDLMRIAIGGSNKFVFKASGDLEISNTIDLFAATVRTTSATGGAATALPALPDGYITIHMDGVNKKIPYYAN